MKKTILILLIALIGVSLLILFRVATENVEKKELFDLKDTYVGDNSTVRNIIGQLPEYEHVESMELQTGDEPYGITINYKLDGTNRKDIDALIVYNATFLFALVQNADWVEFHFENHHQKVTRQQFESWYNEDLRNYTNEIDLKNLIDKHLKEQPNLPF